MTTILDFALFMGLLCFYGTIAGILAWPLGLFCMAVARWHHHQSTRNRRRFRWRNLNPFRP